jgi:hypothetical protein
VNATASASAAAKVITITQAGVTLAEAIINDYVNVYAFNTYLYKVRTLVQSSMADYVKQARSTPPANYCIAYSYISDLASLCSLAAMKAMLDQQVALPSNVGNTQTASGKGTPAGARMVTRAPSAFSPAYGGPNPTILEELVRIQCARCYLADRKARADPSAMRHAARSCPGRPS